MSWDLFAYRVDSSLSLYAIDFRIHFVIHSEFCLCLF